MWSCHARECSCVFRNSCLGADFKPMWSHISRTSALWALLLPHRGCRLAFFYSLMASEQGDPASGLRRLCSCSVEIKRRAPWMSVLSLDASFYYWEFPLLQAFSEWYPSDLSLHSYIKLTHILLTHRLLWGCDQVSF